MRAVQLDLFVSASSPLEPATAPTPPTSTETPTPTSDHRHARIEKARVDDDPDIPTRARASTELRDHVGDAQFAARALAQRLSERLGIPVRLVLTNNRRTMISVKETCGRLEVRLHHMFVHVDPGTEQALGTYLRRRTKASGQILDAFIDANSDQIKSTPNRAARLVTAGDVHDLAPMFDRLTERYFPQQMNNVRITWGRRARARRRQRSIQLGTYSLNEQLIRIHRVLDQDWVPAFYVESVLFHEMLHHALPPIKVGGRMQFHTPQFRALERAFEFYDLAQQWEHHHLSKLLKSRR